MVGLHMGHLGKVDDVLGVASGPMVKLVSCKSALIPQPGGLL